MSRYGAGAMKSYKLAYNVPDAVYLELGKIAATAGRIEFAMFGMVHDLLQSPLPGISGAKAVAGELGFIQTARLIQKLLDETFGRGSEESVQWKGWLKEANVFMAQRNALLHANWMSAKGEPVIPVQRKNLVIDSEFDLDQLQNANADGELIVAKAFSIAQQIQAELRPDI